MHWDVPVAASFCKADWLIEAAALSVPWKYLISPAILFGLIVVNAEWRLAQDWVNQGRSRLLSEGIEKEVDPLQSSQVSKLELFEAGNIAWAKHLFGGKYFSVHSATVSVVFTLQVYSTST